MDFRQLLLIALLGSTVLGCRRDPYVDAYFDMLNAEKRVLEDRLYEAEYNYEKTLRELQTCKTKSSSTRPRDSREDDDRQIPPDEPPDLPEVEYPPGFQQSTERSSSERYRPVGTGVLHARDESPVREAKERRTVASPAPATDQQVAAIHLNARRTGGMELDGMPGDDGISVLIEPRNAQGQFVARPGTLHLVLLDPLKRGEEARFARWDFDADTARRMMKADGLDRGVHVRVPWPDVPPTTDRLHLFVRYTTEDQRALETDREILVRSADLVADRWTPRAEASASRMANRTPPATTRPSPGAESQVVPASHETVLPQPSTADPPSAKTGSERSAEWSPVR